MGDDIATATQVSPLRQLYDSTRALALYAYHETE